MVRRRVLFAATGVLALCGVLLLLRGLYWDTGSTSAGSRPPLSTATVTVTLAPSQPPNTPTPTVPAEPAASPASKEDPGSLPAGLLCRDLIARGYSYADSVAYWHSQGDTAQMDVDHNGRPCETVYPKSDVLKYYGPIVTAQAPEGKLHILGPTHGNYGQSGGAGNCANWTLRFVNDSDTAISRVVFAPPNGSYTGPWDPSAQSYSEVAAAPPEAEVIVVSLAPGEARDVAFQTCTSTPPPVDPNYEFGVRTPLTIPFTWVTGATGTTAIT